MSKLFRRLRIRTHKAFRDFYQRDADPDLNEGTGLITLVGGAAVGVSVIVVASGIHMISVLTTSPPSALALAHLPTFGEGDSNYRWGHSTALQQEEELCVFRKRGMSPYLDCSPAYDKSRKPGGKLISARLPSTSTIQVSDSIRAAAILPIPALTPQLKLVEPNVVGWYDVVFPERAPKNLRLIRSEQAADVQPAGPLVSASANVSKPRQQCKARSYWSEKHKECRRRRGRSR